MLTNRFELKIPIGIDLKQQILDGCANLLAKDPNGEDARYRVSSQYFDTSDLASFRQKLDGERVRRKYRLRYYTTTLKDRIKIDAAFMEVKHRVNNIIFKERVKLLKDKSDALLAGSISLKNLVDHVDPADRQKLSTIATLTRAANEPTFDAVNIITYMREAWEGTDDSRFRLTFDTECRVYGPANYYDVADAKGVLLIPEEQALMEVKFNDAIPRWFRDVVNEFGLTIRRFSKYGAGVEKQHAMQLETPRGSNLTVNKQGK